MSNSPKYSTIFSKFLLPMVFAIHSGSGDASEDDGFHLGVFGGYMDVLGLGNAGNGVEIVFSQKYSVRYAQYLGDNTIQNWFGKSLSILVHPMNGSFYFELGAADALRENTNYMCIPPSPTFRWFPVSDKCGNTRNFTRSIDGKVAIGNKWKIFNGLTLGGEWQGLYYPMKIYERTEPEHDIDTTLNEEQKTQMAAELRKDEWRPAIFHIYLLMGLEY